MHSVRCAVADRLDNSGPEGMTMREIQLTAAQKKCLEGQVISAEEPGTVLRDFRMLLEFVGPKGVEAGGKYNLLPIKLIGEMDGRLSRPIHLEMKRPQIRSHPYLQGLNLLLRATGLCGVEGTGDKGRLVVVPVMLAQWDRLNLTEQYFNLLEAWLRLGRAEMVGESGRRWGGLLPDCLGFWTALQERPLRLNPEKPQDVYLSGIGRNYYQLALMDLFGLVEVKQPAPPVTRWTPAGVKPVPFGDAVFTALMPHMLDSLRGVDVVGEDEEEEVSTVPLFGAWQPLFQPFFPEWRENLLLPEEEPREGTFVFRMSVGKIWRLIAMPAEATLDDLVDCVLRSLNFDSDHLYEFTYRDRMGIEVQANHSAMDEGPWADQVPIGTLPLEPGQSMVLLYDFGDSWKFTLKLVRIEPPDGKSKKAKAPRILESHGKAPEQYPSWDD